MRNGPTTKPSKGAPEQPSGTTQVESKEMPDSGDTGLPTASQESDAESTNQKGTGGTFSYLSSAASQLSILASDATNTAMGAVRGGVGVVAQQGLNLATSVASETVQAGQTALDVTGANKFASGAVELVGDSIRQGASLAVSAANVTGQMVVTTTQAIVGATVGSAAQATLDSIGILRTTLSQSSTITGELIGQRFAELLTNAGSVATQAGSKITTSVDALAGAPNTNEGVHIQGVRIAIGLIPILGEAQGIGAARKKYHHALTIEDHDKREQMMHEARRDCLIAVSQLSITLATLGVSGKIDVALKAGGFLVSALNAGKTAREVTESSSWLPKIDADVLSPRIDLALTYEPLREAMDIILRANTDQPNDPVDGASSRST